VTTYSQFMQGIRPRPPKPPRGIPNPKPRDPHGPYKPMPGQPGAPPTPPAPQPNPNQPPAPTPLSPFEAWYMTNPAYLAAHPNYVNQQNQLQAQYGLVKNAQGQWVPASGAGSENGLMQQLQRALAGQSQGIQDSANSHGLLFSGAQAQMQQNAKAKNAQDQFDAVEAFTNAMNGINTQESNLISSLYDDYIKQAPPGSPPAVAAAKKKAADDAAAKAEADRKARVKKAQDHLKADRAKAAAAKRRKKRRKPSRERPGGGMTGGIAGGGA